MSAEGEKVGDLFVEIGGMLEPLEKDIERAESMLESAGRQMRVLGLKLSAALSIPIINTLVRGLRMVAAESLEALGEAGGNFTRSWGEVVDLMFGVTDGIDRMAERIQSLSDWINGLTDTQKKMLGWAATITAALGPLTFIIGQLIVNAKVISAAFKVLAAGVAGFLGPVAAAIAAIASLATLLFVAAGEGDTFKERWLDGFQKVSAAVVRFSEQARERLTGWFPYVKFTIGAFRLSFVAALDMIAFAVVAWSMNLVNRIEWFADNWREILHWFATATIVRIGNTLLAVEQVFKNLWHNIKEGSMAAWDFFFGDGDAVKAQFRGIMDGVREQMTDVPPLDIPPPEQIDIGLAIGEKQEELANEVLALWEKVFQETGDKEAAFQATRDFVDGEEEKQRAIRDTRAEMEGFFSFADAVNKVQTAIQSDFDFRQDQKKRESAVPGLAKGPGGETKVKDPTLASKMDTLTDVIRDAVEDPKPMPIFG